VAVSRRRRLKELVVIRPTAEYRDLHQPS
jgi:hypothetical protein